MNIAGYLGLTMRAPTVPSDVRKTMKESDKRVVSRASHGSIRLQRGEYSTQEDIDEQYERVKSLLFDDS